jgi:hypothetical protein
MPFEPLPGEECHLFECARFFKEMRGAGDDLQAFLAAKLGEGFAVQLQYGLIFATDDQHRRGFHLVECGSGQIGASAARDYCCHIFSCFRCGDQSGSSSCACAEEPHLDVFDLRALPDPRRCVSQPFRQEIDVESQVPGLPVEFLFLVQQVEQQRGDAGVLQDASDILISGTVAAAPTSMREEHDAAQILGDDQLALQNYPVGGNLDVPCLSAAILRSVSTLFLFLPVSYIPMTSFPS